MAYGLDDLIRSRVDDLYGILNGIDVALWNPATDPRLAANYDIHTFTDKRLINKRFLQDKANLPVRDNVMVIGMVSRLVWQKGLDMAIPALRQFLAGYDVQFVSLGTGASDLEHGMWRLAQDFHWRARAYLEFDAAIAQHIYAGVDLFLMPSHYEPCGTGQMVAMRYGTLPLVRETGGLADTVVNYDNGDADHGTGFAFHWEEAQAIVGTLRWALKTYEHRPDAWRRMQERAMQQDFSWQTSAKHYSDLYERIVHEKRGKHDR
jgi:starch synthase